MAYKINTYLFSGIICTEWQTLTYILAGQSEVLLTVWGSTCWLFEIGFKLSLCLFMALPPSVSNRKWWLGQLSPYSQPLCRSSFSQNPPPTARQSCRTPPSSLRGKAELSCPPTGSVIAPAWGCLGSVLSTSPRFLPLSVFMGTPKCVHVCARAGDAHCRNSWIAEARQDFWTVLEQMVGELDQGIKAPETEGASVADGWDCGIVSWGLGVWALLCSLFYPPFCHRRKCFSHTFYAHPRLSSWQASTQLRPTHTDVAMNIHTLGGLAGLTALLCLIHDFVKCLWTWR